MCAAAGPALMNTPGGEELVGRVGWSEADGERAAVSACVEASAEGSCVMLSRLSQKRRRGNQGDGPCCDAVMGAKGNRSTDGRAAPADWRLIK